MSLPSIVVAQHQDKVISGRWHPNEFSFISSSADKTCALWALPPLWSQTLTAHRRILHFINHWHFSLFYLSFSLSLSLSLSLSFFLSWLVFSASFSLVLYKDFLFFLRFHWLIHQLLFDFNARVFLLPSLLFLFSFLHFDLFQLIFMAGLDVNLLIFWRRKNPMNDSIWFVCWFLFPFLSFQFSFRFVLCLFIFTFWNPFLFDCY